MSDARLLTSNLHSVGKIDELLLALGLQPGTFDYRATVLDWLNSAVETKPDGVLPDARLIRSALFQQFMRQGFWHAHHVDLMWRMDGKDVREEADWLKDVWYALRNGQKASAPAGDWVIVCGDSWYGDNGKFVRNEWEARGFPSCRDAQEFAKGMRCPWSVHERTQYKRPERKAENGTAES